MLFCLFIFMFLLTFNDAQASCAFAEQAEKSGKINIALAQYIYCAEEENDAEAQYKLGAMFYKGVGVKSPDFKRSVAFFSRAARNGYAPAQVKLGLLYWRGEGIEKNLKMAHKWLYLAQEPENMRWFYPVGASSDNSAAGLYSKLSGAIKSSKTQEEASAPFPAGVSAMTGGREIIPSYKEVAEFQHASLIEAGEDLLDDAGQRDLRRFLNNLPSDVSPKFPADFAEEEKQRTSQAVWNWFKPVLLTPANFNFSKVPVLEKLKKEIEQSAD